MKKLILCSIVMFGLLAMGSQVLTAQACGSYIIDEEAIEAPAPAPTEPSK